MPFSDTGVKQVRAIFLSDSHIGFRFSRAEALLGFLRNYRPEALYLVGDFLDGWRLRRRWYWPPVYSELVNHILQLSRQGVEICYTPGNHDDFLRSAMPDVSGVRIHDHFIHVALDGRRFCVTHGDLFDSVERKLHGLSQFGGRLYDGLTWFNYGTNRLLNSVGLRDRNYCFWIKRTSKRIVRAVNDFERLLTEFAQSHACQGVICGHIHLPCIADRDGFIYCNTGDWVEHSSALIETHEGVFRLQNNGTTMGTLYPVEDISQSTRPEPETVAV